LNIDRKRLDLHRLACHLFTRNMKLKEFAQKHLELYTSFSTKELLVSEGFGELCLSLGLNMDCGTSFVRSFPRSSLGRADDLASIIASIYDPYFLGDAIFSNWYNISFRTNESLLSDNNRWWFIIAFTRLVQIVDFTEPFEGEARKMELVSECSLFWPFDRHSQVVRQRLTIDEGGSMKLVSYKIGEKGLAGCNTVKAKAEAKVLDLVVQFFRRGYLEPLVMDAGSWTLKLTSKEGKVYTYEGSLTEHLVIQDQDLSDLLRSQLEGAWGFCEEPWDKEEFMYLKVSFTPGGQEYSYLCDDPWVKPKDKVAVQNGDRASIATVQSVGFYSKDNVPYPLEKTKKILGLARCLS
jgi:hypothetical protein